MAKLVSKSVAKSAVAAKATKPVAKGKAPAADTNIAKLGAAIQAKADAKAKKPAPAAPDNDTITYMGPDKSMKNAGKLVVKAGDSIIMIDGDKLTKQLTSLAEVGGSLAALEAYLAKASPKAKLANGVTAKDAPHSAKAIADKASKPTKVSAPRAAAPDNARITATAKGAAKAEKMGAKDRLSVMIAAGTVSAALTSMKMADINYAAKCGLIVLG
jgi:hypothetical protein